MYKVLLFGGTVEGRTVAEYLNENKIPAMVCVATEYGESLLPQGEYLELSHNRLDEKQMEEKMLCTGSDGKYRSCLRTYRNRVSARGTPGKPAARGRRDDHLC